MKGMGNLISEVKAALQAATPGPWTIWERSDRIQVVQTDGEWSICDMDGGDWEMWQSNAHLIANSPTWLKQLLDRLETAERQREEAVKALESKQPIRESVEWFAEQMEQRLKENDHKDGWEECDRGFLLDRLEANYHKLWAKQQAYGVCFDAEGTIKKAANIANFAMMLADQARTTLKRIKGENG